MAPLLASPATLLLLIHRPMPETRDRTIRSFCKQRNVWTAIILGTAFTGVYAWAWRRTASLLRRRCRDGGVVIAREQHLYQLDGLPRRPATESEPPRHIALGAKEVGRELTREALSGRLTLCGRRWTLPPLMGKLASSARRRTGCSRAHDGEATSRRDRGATTLVRLVSRGLPGEGRSRPAAAPLAHLRARQHRRQRGRFRASGSQTEEGTAGEVRIVIRETAGSRRSASAAGDPYVTRERDGRSAETGEGGDWGSECSC